MNKLSDKIPDVLKGNILSISKNDIEYNNVYRVSKSGLINEETFKSTYEEIIDEDIPQGKHKLDNIYTYSTSCYDTISPCEKFLNFQKKMHPSPCIIKGNIKKGLGETFRENNGHIHWWIYKDYERIIIGQNLFKIFVR